MSFPTGLTLLDNFNRGDASPLDGNWARIAALGADLNLNSLQVISPSATNRGAYWTATTFGDDNGCYVTMATKVPNGNFVLLAVRGTNLNHSSTDDSYYQLLMTPGSGTDAWSIDKVVNGSFTSGLATGSQETSSGDLIGFSAVGTRISAWYNSGSSWVEVCFVVDSGGTSIATGGQVGMGLNDAATGALDSFFGGTISGAAPVADFTGTPTSVASGGSVVFTDASTNTPTSWSWQKSSDGGTTWVNFAGSPTSQNPTETFS